MVFIVERGIKFLKKTTLYLLSLLFIAEILLFISSLSSISLADGWVQQKGKGLFIGTFAIQQFNGNDLSGQYDKDKKIMQVQYLFYGEYGITNRITLGGKMILTDSFINSKNSWFKKADKQSFAVDNTQIFMRFQIYRNKWLVLSYGSAIQSPSVYKQNEASAFSIKRWQYEQRMELGIALGENNFFTAMFAYHGNIKHWYDEMHLDLTFGHYFIKELLMTIKFQKYFYLINNTKKIRQAFGLTNLSLADYFSQHGFSKLTISMIASVNEKTSFEFGFYSTLKAKWLGTQYLNINMRGLYFSLWIWI